MCGILGVLSKTNFYTESGRSLADGDRAAELLARLTVEILIVITNQLGYNNILKSCSHTQIDIILLTADLIEYHCHHPPPPTVWVVGGVKIQTVSVL